MIRHIHFLATVAFVLAFAAPAFAAGAPTGDTTHIVGHLHFKEGMTVEQVMEAAKALVAKFPAFDRVYVRQDGEKTFGIDLTYKLKKQKPDNDEFVAQTKKFIDEKYGKDTMNGWDLSNTIFWVKK